MSESFIYRTDALLLAALLFILMLMAIYGGLRTGRYKSRKRQVQEENPGNTTILASLVGLMGFLLAFTFGMSGSRYDKRSEAVLQEANSIGTALLRADLYPDSIRDAFRADFKAYTEARIAFYEVGRHQDKIADANREAENTGSRLWTRAATLAHDKENLIASNQMIPALNEMLDNASLRNMGEKARVPDSIVFMLFILSIASAFYVGYSSAHKGRLDWLVVCGFCLLTVVVIYITLDLDRPRRGLIKTDYSHQAMLELRKLYGYNKN